MTARHLAPVAGDLDLSAIERQRIDQQRAARAIVVLAQTDRHDFSRELYAALLAAGALFPPVELSVPVSVLLARHDGRSWAA